MLEDDIVNCLKLRPGIVNLKDELLRDLVHDTLIEVLDYTNSTQEQDLPKGCISLIKDIAVVRINSLGDEGLNGTSREGINQTYGNDVPESIKRKLRRYRRLP